MEDKNWVLEQVTKFYLGSPDCNGYPLINLNLLGPKSSSRLIASVEQLVRERRIDLVFGSVGNPHVKLFPDLPVSGQIERLAEEGPEDACAYPTEAVIRTTINIEQFDDRPFTKRYVLGEPGLIPPLVFDLTVLEPYYADPRYVCGGGIRILDKFYDELPKEDRVSLNTFGRARNRQGDRAVATFLCYLRHLPPKHQRLWNEHLAVGAYEVDKDWLHVCLTGNWSPRTSIYTAILEEQEVIGKMCKAMERPSLFRESFRWERRPRGFCPLLRPTKRNFVAFVQDLDKMLSDNLNHDFFKGEIDLQEETGRANGKVIVTPKGTLRLLGEFLEAWVVRFGVHGEENTDIRALLKPLRNYLKTRS